MKKTYIFIALIMLTNYTFAKKETLYVNHKADSGAFLDDGIDYIVKPIGNGHCLYPNGTTPRSLTIHSITWSAIGGQFQINFISHIARWCGYHTSSQDFEVHSLNGPSVSATFQWYSPCGKNSRMRVLNDPHHIVKGKSFNSIVVGKSASSPK